MNQFFLFYHGEVFPPSVVTNAAGQKLTFFDAKNLNEARQVARVVRELGFDVELFRDTQQTRSIKF